jgi:hypothetical protein
MKCFPACKEISLDSRFHGNDSNANNSLKRTRDTDTVTVLSSIPWEEYTLLQWGYQAW